jgi:Glycosyl transferase family 2
MNTKPHEHTDLRRSETGNPAAKWPELAFVMAPRQNLFFDELVEALRQEARALGARTSLHIGNFPAPRPDLVYVLVPPHEYFTLMHGRIGPPPEALRRTIFICAEQPGSPFFDANLSLAPLGGAVFDINRFAVQAFAREGIKAHHLQLGWTPGWDHLAERERDIDILFMGCISDRREQALARYARSFSRRRVQLVLSDNSRPNWTPSQAFRTDAAKWDLLGRAKILINIHQDEEPYFEWLRIVQAMSNGAVVVSEHSVDFAPLVPGRHLLVGEADSLHLLAELLLDDGDRWWKMQTAAYLMVRNELPLCPGVERLLGVASEVAAAEPLPDPEHRFFTQPPPDPETLGVFNDAKRPPSPAQGDHNAAMIRRGVKDIKLDLLDMRRHQARINLTLATGQPPPVLELVGRTRAYPAGSPRVSILVALFNYEKHVTGALDSVLSSEDCPFEIVVVDDGSSDRSLSCVRDWMAAHEDVNALLLRHPINRGLAHARNSALGWARGEFCFVLDADNEIYPHCLPRLTEALDADPTAVFAYGTLECFRTGQPVGLINKLPWEPSRLRMGNYIDAMAMVRTQLLREEFGGYSLDRRLHGWEDFDLWCRMAEAGHHAVRVPEMLGRYRLTQHSMLSQTNISATDAFSLIIESNPRLMAGMEPPE